jgi:hypothetical protein
MRVPCLPLAPPFKHSVGGTAVRPAIANVMATRKVSKLSVCWGHYSNGGMERFEAVVTRTVGRYYTNLH